MCELFWSGKTWGNLSKNNYIINPIQATCKTFLMTKHKDKYLDLKKHSNTDDEQFDTSTNTSISYKPTQKKITQYTHQNKELESHALGMSTDIKTELDHRF